MSDIDVERRLLKLWENVLKTSVAPDDNFFDLGGDSLSALRLISLARRQQINVTAKLLYANPTVRSLAATCITFE